ncbi:hypothetical protein HELRODRAFT_189756 [Helobdella robusta]|uniref:Uncharacterized protein n=1 Tax=Helobdella robusta TaxID=6412 RepID=T1FRC3_HELRO|nr:hypothetical protein HELRODRAFT_189756 [Helobdella robusta]ESN91656.1 hypothetical protein HELRODRAFT_189756 [Helobdella robusta]
MPSNSAFLSVATGLPRTPINQNCSDSAVVNELMWKVLESNVSLVGLDEVRGQKLIVDSRCWYHLLHVENDQLVTSCRKSQRNCKLNNSGDTKKTASSVMKEHDTNSKLQIVFWQLFNLNVNQLRLLVLFEKLKATKSKRDAAINKQITFNNKSKELLTKMSIPYENVDDIDLELAKRIKNNDFDASLTNSSSMLLYGCGKVFHHKSTEATLSKCNQSLQSMKLVRYSSDDQGNKSILLALYALLTFYQSGNYKTTATAAVIKNSDRPGVSQHRSRLFSVGFEHPDDFTKSCSDDVESKQSTISTKSQNSSTVTRKKSAKKSAVPCKDASNNGESDDKVVGGSEVSTRNGDGTCAKSDDKMFNLIFEFVHQMKDKSLLSIYKRLEQLCSSSTAAETSFEMTDVEKALSFLFTDKLTSHLNNIQKHYHMKEESLGSPRSDDDIKWTRPDFHLLQEYTKSLHLSLPCKQLLSYVVAFDLYYLSNGIFSGDSFPDGFSRPEKIMRLSKKKEAELYEIKWSFIPGTEALRSRDLVTTEYKNVFSAAFPKIASKFEGWKLRSDDDDDEDEEDGGDELARKSPSPVKKDRGKRKTCDPMDTPASNSSGRTTLKDYYVARKRLNF